MNNLQNNEPNPFNKHVLSEFRHKIDVSNFPAEHEAEIDQLILQSKLDEESKQVPKKILNFNHKS